MSLPADTTPTPSGWGSLKYLTGYHWFVFIVCCLAWDLDCMDQQLFVLARNSAVDELLANPAEDDPRRPEIALKLQKPENDKAVTAAIKKPSVDSWAGWATAVFLIGWATGGIGFGIMGDRVGRVKTLMTTILLYSVFTGLSSFSLGINDFLAYRFLTGLGVGGVFAVAVSLVAETVPQGSRPYVLGLLQASSVFGNCAAAIIGITLGSLQRAGEFKDVNLLGFAVTPWRIMFMIGVLPALLTVFIQGRLKEPEKWKAAKAAGVKAGSFGQLFGDPRWRKNALLGLLLAFAGVVGLWGIGFFAVDLQRSVFSAEFKQQAADAGLTGDAATAYAQGKGQLWGGYTSLVQNMGAFLGIYGFTWLTSQLGRKPAFAIFFVAATISTAIVFMKLTELWQIFVLVPIMGFCQLALFGGYAIYFPELFPTRLRSTGTSFCYNVGRLVAASGPAVLGLLTSEVFTIAKGYEEPMRYAGLSMCSVFLLGLIALPFLPETKGKPLPE